MKAMGSLLLLLTVVAVGCKTDSKTHPVWTVPDFPGTAGLPDGFKTNVIVIRAIHGKVEQQDGTNSWVRVKVNQKFTNGTVLRTANDSWTDISIGHQCTLRLCPDSVLSFDLAAIHRNDPELADTQTMLSVHEGSAVISNRRRTTNSIFLVLANEVLVDCHGDIAVCARGKIISVTGQDIIKSKGEVYSLSEGEYFDPQTKAVLKVKRDLIKALKFITEGKITLSLITPSPPSAQSPFEQGLEEAHQLKAGHLPPPDNYFRAANLNEAEICK